MALLDLILGRPLANREEFQERVGPASSPYRFVVQPIVDYVLALEREYEDRTIAVVIPQLMERRWYYYFLHNQRLQLLAAQLL